MKHGLVTGCIAWGIYDELHVLQNNGEDEGLVIKRMELMLVVNYLTVPQFEKAVELG